jgi:hypothetical protein
VSSPQVTGIGKVGERVLREVLGVTKCGELLEQRAMIFALFSNIAFGKSQNGIYP